MSGKEVSKGKLRQFLWLTILAILMGTTACESRETESPFETIERSGYSDYSVQEPRVVLVTSKEEIDLLAGLVRQTALDQLAELDFGKSFAIAVFRGRKSDTGFDTIIERVTRQDDKFVVYAQFWEPSSCYEINPEETSPYHLIKVYSDSDISRETAVVLQSRAVTPTPPPR
jgi:hypothetical protein